MFKIHSGNPAERCPSLESLEVRVTDWNAGGILWVLSRSVQRRGRGGSRTWPRELGRNAVMTEASGTPAANSETGWRVLQSCSGVGVRWLSLISSYFFPTGGVPLCPSPGKGVSLGKAALFGCGISCGSRQPYSAVTLGTHSGKWGSSFICVGSPQREFIKTVTVVLLLVELSFLGACMHACQLY